jgi:hypothetical protein
MKKDAETKAYELKTTSSRKTPPAKAQRDLRYSY